MAKNHVLPGIVIDVTASGASYISGDLIQVGDLAGVCLVNIADGETGSVQIEEVFEVPKLATDVVAAGASLYLDAANKRVTLDAASGANKYAGKAIAAAGNGAAKVKLKLNA